MIDREPGVHARHLIKITDGQRRVRYLAHYCSTA
jgi:hypothetical protein